MIAFLFNTILSKDVNNLQLADTLNHLRFFYFMYAAALFWLLFSLLSQNKKEKSAQRKCPWGKQRNSKHKQNIGIKL